MLHYRMTKHSSAKHRRAYHGRGAGIMDWARKAYGFVKKHNLLSRGAAALAPYAGSYAPALATAGKMATAVGLGRRRGARRYTGRGLRLAGGYRRVLA